MTNCHICGRSHRAPTARARCISKHAHWIHGAGRWALLAHCDVLTVTLWPRRREAERARTVIDRSGCGHDCTRHHELIDLHGTTLRNRL